MTSGVLAYALSLKQDGHYAQLSLEDAVNEIIKLHAFVFRRLSELPDQQRRAAEAQQIVRSKDRISVFEAARIVTPRKNITNSVDRLKRALHRLRQDYASIRAPHILELIGLLDLALMAASKRNRIERYSLAGLLIFLPLFSE